MNFFLFGLLVVVVAALMLIADHIFRKARRGRRAQKDAAIDELVRGQLSSGEELLCVDRQRESSPVALLFTVFFILMGAVIVLFSVAIFIFLDDDIALMGRLIFLLGFGSIGVLMAYWGVSVFRLAKKYFFVTNQRLAVRSFTTWTGKLITEDYPAEKLVKFTIWGEQQTATGHQSKGLAKLLDVHYNIFLYVDVGKRRPKVITLTPENDVQRLTDAILQIGAVCD